MLSLTHQALEKFDNQHDFERMCADILNSLGYRDVVLIAPRGGSDGGRDITYTSPDGLKGLACVTLRLDTDQKFKEDFHQRNKDDFDEYILFTNQYLTATQKKTFTAYCLESLDALFQPKDVEVLRSLLETVLQSLRSTYLHIDPDQSIEYSLEVTDLERFTATDLLAEARSTYDATKNRFQNMSSVAYRIPESFPALGISSTSEILEAHTEYIEKLETLDKKLSNAIAFNIMLMANYSDQNIEVRIEPPQDAKFIYDSDFLAVPEPPKVKTNLYEVALPGIGNITTHRSDANEFDAKVADGGVELISSLKVLNAHRKKYVLDVPFYLTNVKQSKPIELRVTVYSQKLKKPYEEVLSIKYADAILVQASPEEEID